MSFSDLDCTAVLRALPDVVVIIDDAGYVLGVNTAAEALFGLDADEFVGQMSMDFVHPHDAESARTALRSLRTAGRASAEIRINGAAGCRLVEVNAAPTDPAGPSTSGPIVLTMRDLTDRRRWDDGSDEDQLRTLVHNAASLTLLVSDTGDVISASGAFDRELGIDDAVGVSLVEMVVDEDRPRIAPALAEATRRRNDPGDRRVQLDVMMRHAVGRRIPFQLSIVDQLDDPTVSGYVVTAHDVSELHATRAELAHTASHDPLTGLGNRVALRSEIEMRLELAPDDPSFAVGFLDLDRFKPVNDLYGHEAGDELLVAVAGRLKHALRAGDVVTRYGGDEFVIVAGADDLGQALQMAERLEAAIAEPFGLSCGVVQIYASVGVVLADKTSSVDSLLTESDAAMYSVKHGRRGSPAAARRSVAERRSIADALADAFDDDQFAVHYQPIVDLAEYDVVGYEALVRWQHPERGLLLPKDFLDVVEELGREGDLGDVVLTTALRDLTFIEEATGTRPYMSVNASARQLADPTLVDHVGSVLDGAGIPPERLTIEVSERSILEQSMHSPSAPVLMGVQSLKALGVQIAADDFGTGATSLTNLVSYPIDSLKIDRSFVDGVLADEHRRTIVSALVTLASDMGYVVVAEGVEEIAQCRLLRDHGCGVAQGYLFGAPMPVRDVVAHRVMRL